MLNLREFRRKPNRLSDWLVWAAMIHPGVILNKDGSLQVSFRFRGPDLDSATDQELVVLCERMNNALKRLAGGWVIYAEAQRRESKQYAAGAHFPDPVSRGIDLERRGYFSLGNHYESAYFFTLVYLPPEDNQDKLKNMMIEQGEEARLPTGTEHFNTFREEAEKIFQLFAEILPEAEPLTPDETLTYLHGCVSTRRFKVKTPEIPMYLDAFLADTPLTGGLKPRLGDHHIRVVSVLSYPGTSMPGLLNKLNQMNFEYRWVSRFIALDKTDADKEISKYQRLWFAKRKSMLGLIKEMLTQTESAQVNESAVIKAQDAATAATELGEDYVSYGYYTLAVVLLDSDEKAIEKNAKQVEKICNTLGFTAITETLNAVDAWFGSLPGMCRSNVRRPLLHTLNLTHMLPLSAIWAGPERNKHLNGPVLLYTETVGNTPFRLDLHVGDVGHTMVVGPTGAGKSVHLCLLAAQFRKYPDAQVYIFDKGGSSRALTAGIGGHYYDLAKETEGSLSFQPLAQIDDDNERAWAANWIHEFLVSENVEMNPERKILIWDALSALANSPPQQRTITGLSLFVQDQYLKAALTPLTLEGAFGRLFDSSVDTLETGRWQVFEMETLMNTPPAVPPMLSFLFHRLEQRLTGAPTLIILDECWMFFDNPIFEAKIKEWLKVLRKANAAVVFATQSLQDIASSRIAPAILDSCPTRIFLPNANAMDERVAKIYEMFGLNERETQILSMATPKRHYYYKSVLGSRLYELGLQPFALAYVGASSIEDQRKVQEILAEFGLAQFNRKWVEYKGLAEFASVL